MTQAELNATIAEARNATGDARKELSRRILAMFSEGRDGKIERFKATYVHFRISNVIFYFFSIE